MSIFLKKYIINGPCLKIRGVGAKLNKTERFNGQIDLTVRYDSAIVYF